MKIRALIVSLFIIFIPLLGIGSAQNKVVIIPIGGSTGNAETSDVLKDKTFSSAAGEGLTGTLEIRNGSKIYTNSIGMKFSPIPAGSFVMGSPNGSGDGSGSPPCLPIRLAETGRIDDERQHVVILTKAFYMQTTEVTQGQWQNVMGSNPSHFTVCGSDCPVENVSFNDVTNFIDSLNVREGRTNCDSAPCYSLPTEAQWEYAARAETVTAFYNGDIADTDCDDPNVDKIGWYCGNAGGTTHPAAQKKPNNWGLYDMSGNVWELVSDWYGAYLDGPLTDPKGPEDGSKVVSRGGAWSYLARQARSANRANQFPGENYNFLGFRLILSQNQ